MTEAQAFQIHALKSPRHQDLFQGDSKTQSNKTPKNGKVRNKVQLLHKAAGAGSGEDASHSNVSQRGILIKEY